MHTAARWLGRIALVALISLGLSGTSAADDAWGVRLGVSDDPDQVVGGVHWDLGPIADRWRWQPSVEIGSGDDITTFAGNLLAAYRFRTDERFTPYVGGQLSVVYYDFDDFGSETEVGPALVAGLDWPIRGDRRFMIEAQFGGSDLPDTKLMLGWTFD